MRSNATIRRLAMYKAKPIRSRDGKFITGPYMSNVPDAKVKRVQPDRRWFGTCGPYVRVCVCVRAQFPSSLPPSSLLQATHA